MASDYAQLARRISAVTTNCLVTAVVLVAGLGFGRQVLRWWGEEPADRPAAMPPGRVADGLTDPAQLHLIRFGERPWSLRRQSIAGDSETAAARLRTICRDVLRRGVMGEGGMASRGEAAGRHGIGDDVGDEFLAQLAASEAAEQEPGRWRLYQLDGAYPMVIGTRPRASAEDAARRENLAGAAHGMVVWGLAVPAGPEAWTLFAFEPEAAAAGQTAGTAEIPIPAACRRTLSMEVAGGGGTVAFEGEEAPEEWIGFYDRWFTSYDWRAVDGWRQYGDRWHARYVAGGRQPAGSAEVHFSGRGPGRSVGLLIISGSLEGTRQGVALP